MSRLRKLRLLLPGFLLARFSSPGDAPSPDEILRDLPSIHIPGIPGASAEAPFERRFDRGLSPNLAQRRGGEPTRSRLPLGSTRANSRMP